MMLIKLQADFGKVDLQTLLSWANMARNSLQMWNAFSSHQIVFGQNPNIPNIMSDSLPALHGTTSSEEFARHLNVLHAARRVFIQTEADERIRRPLRNKVRASEQVLNMVIMFSTSEREKCVGLDLERWYFKTEKWCLLGMEQCLSPNRLQKINDSMSPGYHEANSYESLNVERSNATGSTSADHQTSGQTNMQTIHENIPSSDSTNIQTCQIQKIIN
jgi:hypothetical protein